MNYNKNHISLRDAKVFLDGKEVMETTKCEIKFTPDVATKRTLGEMSDSSRWLGYTIKGTMTRMRTTTWLKDQIAYYLKTKRTPEFTIQGIMDDENSDYFENNGHDTVTVVGCVMTGDLMLFMADSKGDYLEESISFNAKGIV